MPCEVISLDNANPKWDLDYVWTQLLSFRHAKYLLAATCNHTNHGPDAHALMGLNELHAYALLDVKEYGQTRLVKLRNPWGKGEWLGDWSHGSHLWTPLLRQHFEADTNSRTSNGGVFFMAFKDFVDYFTTVDVCKVLPDWDRIVFPCRAIDIHAVPKFTAFQIQALVTGECEISVIQKNTRDCLRAEGSGHEVPEVQRSIDPKRGRRGGDAGARYHLPGCAGGVQQQHQLAKSRARWTGARGPLVQAPARHPHRLHFTVFKSLFGGAVPAVRQCVATAAWRAVLHPPRR
eukprot:c12830_g1_i2.p1 GENE.c12830_g1_i2~~c12830_g1_i2.p1  ORF type:complete len:290 (-),score=51.80 c12830_g1_i2:418-1287(-)